MKEIKRFIPDSASSFFLFGPRGTGKSTWLRRRYPDAIYIDLLSPDFFRRFSARPERLKEIIDANSKRKTIIIDEIQRIPELLSVVHLLMENDKSLKFILTGSSARKLKKGGVDLLSGRAVLKKCLPFMASELGDEFNLDRALIEGTIPLVVDSENSDETLSAYILLYLNEEVKQEGLVRNLGDFSRFMETISFSHGCVLNISNVAREAEVKQRTAQGYVEILGDLMLSHSLPVFSKKAKRHLISRPKFYYFDSGVFTKLRPAGPLDRTEDIAGAALEGFILQNILAFNEYNGNRNKVYYWRTKSGTEVDFIIYGEEFLAIEVKHTDKISNKDLKGLKAFREDYPETSPIFLYRGTERLLIDGILCLPCAEFLLKLKPGATIENSIF